MKIQSILFMGMALLILAFCGCSNDYSNPTLTYKFHANDPFQESMVSSQIFKIDAKKDNVVEGENGTILVMPKGCFINAEGKTHSGPVTIELAEALSLDQMLLSNLTTTSNGQLLETGGMMFFNASTNGQQLSIDKEHPIYVEIPTTNKKPGMMAYKGVRDENGNMNWIEPKALETFLISVDIDLLNFYPEEFEAMVLAGLPFRNHTEMSKALTDSLYYSLSVSRGVELTNGFVGIDYNETYDGSEEPAPPTQQSLSPQKTDINNADWGIDPAIIKTIRSDKFQNTLISTREFETRLQSLFKVCPEYYEIYQSEEDSLINWDPNDLIEIYIKNLDKNLWELDSMIMVMLAPNHHYYLDFDNFYKQRLTNVKEATKHAAQLRTYYKEQLTQIKTELEATRKKVMKELEAKNEVAQKLADEYKGLLAKRERYRMETYGFEMTETGWLNIDVGVQQKDWEYQDLEIIVQDGQNYDRVHTYVIYSSIKSLYRLNSDDQKLFYVGKEQGSEMPIPKQQLAVGVAIAYQAETPFLALKEFTTGVDSKLTLGLEASSELAITEAMKPYDNYGQENNVGRDLVFLKQLAQEKKRQLQLTTESVFKQSLEHTAFPCGAHYPHWSHDDVR